EKARHDLVIAGTKRISTSKRAVLNRHNLFSIGQRADRFLQAVKFLAKFRFRCALLVRLLRRSLFANIPAVSLGMSRNVSRRCGSVILRSGAPAMTASHGRKMQLAGWMIVKTGHYALTVTMMLVPTTLAT